jgi:hypothetical protein
MSDWYYSEFGQTKGPVSEGTLIQKILKEELELDSYVTDGINQPWKKISDIPELLKEIHKPEPIPHNEVFSPEFLTEDISRSQGNLYFHIPLQRFVIMNILSLGLYQIYWFYKQWHFWAVKHKQGYRSPDRELSWILFPWTIFQKIETDRELNAVSRADFSGVLIFWIWTGGGLALYFVIRAFSNVIGISGWAWYLSGCLDVVFLLPIQRYINRVNAKLGNSYDRPGLGHYLCLGIGLATLLMSISLGQLLKLLVF